MRNTRKLNSRRYKIWHRIERALSWIIRGGGFIDSRGFCMYAPCDSFIIGSGPWLCYCCQILRDRVAGVVHLKPRRRVPVGELMLASYMWRYVHTRRGTYVWPDTKYIYP